MEDTPDDGCGLFVNEPMILIFRIFLVSIWCVITGGLARCTLDADSCAHLPGLITQIPLVHDIHEGREFIAAGIVAVHIVGNSDETYIVLPEQHLREVAGLQVVAANTAHVLDKNRDDLACFNVFHQLFPCRTVEIAA